MSFDNDKEIHFISMIKVSTKIKNTIKQLTNLSDRQLEQATFYGAFDLNFLKIACFDYTKRTNNFDSFVKGQDSNFYNVISLYKYSGIDFCLLEQIDVSRFHPVIHLDNVSTDLVHTFVINQIETNNFVVYPLCFISKQVCFIRLDHKLSEIFNAQLEYLIETEN